MALVVKDRVKETTTTTGTGTITLAGAADGYQSFSVIGNTNTTYYAIVGENEWEVGVGTYTSSGTTLSRDTVLESSNSGNKVSFSSGEKQVFCTYPAERSLTTDGGTLTGTLVQSYSSVIWSHSEATHRPVSRKTYSEAGSIGTTGSNITDVYGEADLSAIDNDATFTYAAAWDAVESHGGRLPTLAEVMDGVGAGSGQGYDVEYLWTCTPAGPHHVWVVYGSYSSYPTKKIVDITDSNEVYRCRAFFDVSRDGRQVHYSHDGDVYVKNSRVLTTADEGTGNGLDADTVDGIQASSFLRSDANDTTTGDITISNGQPVLNLNDDGNGSGGGYTGYIAFNNLSGESYRIGDWAATNETGGPDILRIQNTNGTRIDVQFGSSGSTAGSLYVAGDKVFTDGYHPNADKWTTARTNTVTLTGDATGSGSASVDGTGNWTVSVPVTVSNDSHTHDTRYVKKSGDTMTGNLEISKTSPVLTLTDTNTGTGNYPRIDFETSNNQGVSIEHNEFDGELSVAGYGLVVGPSTDNTQFPNTGTLSFNVLGEIYAGGTTLTGLNKVFHDGYHPNADKWTTSRINTVTLTGDVTGTGSAAVDGSGNWTVGVSTTLESDHVYALKNEGTTAGTWIASHADIDSYYEGLSIFFYTNGIAGASTTTLNINNLGAKTIYYNGTTKLTTHYGSRTLIMLYYDATNDRFYCHDFYFSATDYELRWQSDVIVNNSAGSGVAVHGYQLLMEGIDGKYYPVTEGGSTGNTNAVSTAEFKVGGVILAYDAGTDYNANATLTTNSLWASRHAGTMEYWNNRDSGWASPELPIYLVGSINTNGNFVLDNSSYTSFLTQDLPTSDDGKVYIYIGLMQDNYDDYRLVANHPMYVYKEGAVREWGQYASNADKLDGISSSSFLRSDAADSVGGTLSFGESVKAQFGSSNDLQIYHDGNASYIESNTGTFGSLYISSTGSGYGNVWITGATGSTMARFREGAYVWLYYDSDIKFRTSSTGVTVTGTVAADGLDMGDNEKILLGTGDDLEIFHNGTDSFITNNTGHLIIRNVADDKIVSLQTDDGSGGFVDYVQCDGSSGRTNLHYSGVNTLRTASTGADIYNGTEWLPVQAGTGLVWELIDEYTADNTVGAKDFTWSQNEYSRIQVVVEKLECSTDNVYLRARVLTGSSNTEFAPSGNGYYSGTRYSTGPTYQNNANFWFYNRARGIGNGSNEYISGTHYLTLDEGSRGYAFWGVSSYVDYLSYGWGESLMASLWSASAPSWVSGIRLYFSSGNMRAGTIKVYGQKP